MQSDGFWILASAVLLAASVVPARANLITDPGFESCANLSDPPPGWTTSGGSFCTHNPHTGSWDTDFTGGTSEQTLATVAGDNYDFSFWLWPAGASGSFTASFGSDQVFSLLNGGSLPYALQEFTITATSTSTTISFAGATAGSPWSLDDVSVTDLGPATPEPASLVLLASGLLGVAWRFRRRAN